MRLSNTQAVSRPGPVDRNPVGRTQIASNAGLAPHGTTVRWTYTVPAGKKAVCQSALVQVIRQAAAAPVGAVGAQILYTPSGGSAGTIAAVQINTNGVQDSATQAPGAIGDMIAGDVLTSQDFDTSTGGTTQALETAKIFEYDA